MNEEPRLAARKTLLALLTGTAPERRAEIIAIFDEYVADVELLPDAKSSLISTDRRTIRFSFKDLDRCWLLGFSSASAILCYGAHIRVAYKTGQSIDAVIQDDEGLYDAEGEFLDALNAAQRYLGADDVADVPWPPSIPKPHSERNSLRSGFEKVVYDLTLMATAFVMFHEVRHAMICKLNTPFASLKEEEHDCDLWSKSFLLNKSKDFANKYGHDETLSLSKRAMGLAVAALIIHQFTPPEHHSGSSAYYSVGDRLRALIGDIDLPEDDLFWIWASSLMAGLYRRERRPLNYKGINPKLLALQLLKDL